MKKLGTILFWLTLISPWLFVAIHFSLGETDDFGALGALQYMWIAFLFVPVAIASLIVGVLLKKHGMPHKRNIGIALIVMLVLIGNGVLGVVFNQWTDYSTAIVEEAEQEISVELPDEVKVAVEDAPVFGYRLGHVKILDEEDKRRFEKEMQTDERWLSKLPSILENSLPYDLKPLEGYETVLFWNETLKEYNVYPSADGRYTCWLIAYNQENGTLLILEDYLLYVQS